MRYPGGKGKCYQRLINLMPPHETYIEAFLGGGAVLRHKRPSRQSIGIDVDQNVIERWSTLPKPEADVQLVQADAVNFLSSFEYQGNELIYADPPYLPSTRKRPKVYRHDLTEADHRRLLGVLCALPCKVMLSGYASDLYDERLVSWSRFTFKAKAHDGLREERVWTNYALPEALHDSRNLGDTFRDRQTIQRRRNRLHKRIERLSVVERAELLRWMSSRFELQESQDAASMRRA